jgi:hypothetical protein
MYRDPAWMLAPFLTGGKQTIYLPAGREIARARDLALGITRPNGILLAADEVIE